MREVSLQGLPAGSKFGVFKVQQAVSAGAEGTQV